MMNTPSMYVEERLSRKSDFPIKSDGTKKVLTL